MKYRRTDTNTVTHTISLFDCNSYCSVWNSMSLYLMCSFYFGHVFIFHLRNSTHFLSLFFFIFFLASEIFSSTPNALRTDNDPIILTIINVYTHTAILYFIPFILIEVCLSVFVWWKLNTVCDKRREHIQLICLKKFFLYFARNFVKILAIGPFECESMSACACVFCEYMYNIYVCVSSRLIIQQ